MITVAEKELTVYEENGYKNRRDYFKSLAEDYNVDFQSVVMLAELYGPSEDFDGLVIALEDYAEMFAL